MEMLCTQSVTQTGAIYAVLDSVLVADVVM